MLGPNITGKISGNSESYPALSGAFIQTKAELVSVYATTGTYKSVFFDASKSNSIYSGSTVQPASITALILIKF